MLPLAHTYINFKLTGRKTPALIVGGILPDISSTSDEKLPRNLLHNDPERFYAFVSAKYPQLLPLALGVVWHSQINHGADFYSDNHQTGYAYRLGRSLVTAVAKLLKREPDDVSAVLAHKFIEAGVDLNLSQNQPEILALYRASVEAIDRRQVAQCLSDYFAVSSETAKQSLDKLLSILAPKNFISADPLVTGAILPLIKIRQKQDVEAALTLELVKRGVSLTTSTYLEFLNTTVENMRRDFAKYLIHKNVGVGKA